MKPRDLVLTRTEVDNLASYARSQGRARTYRLVRDARHVLHVREQDGRLTPIATLGLPEQYAGERPSERAMRESEPTDVA